MISRSSASPALTRGRSGVNSEATEASIRGDFYEGGWVPYGGVAPLYQWFLDGVVFPLASSKGSNSSVLVKISIDW